MHDTIDELKEVLYFAQEIDNQQLINTCAEELAFKLRDMNPNLDYNQLLFQYGYSNDDHSLYQRR